MNKKTFYVTTPIYYPTDDLHLGHVYTSTLAWILRNYKQKNGYDAIMLTGVDEHGQKIASKAKKNHMSPQEYVNYMDIKIKNLWKKLNINYDFYSRTTNQKHQEAVKKQFSYLFKNGDIYKGKYKGLYSIEDEEFLTKMQAVEKNNEYYHPLSGHKLKLLEEESYFFKMSKYQLWIKNYYQKNPSFVFPKKVVNELFHNFIEKGIEDLSVSRNSFDWGIKIKEDPKHIIYVWLDALNNYITTLGYNQKKYDKFNKYWVNGDEIVHIIGKEITRFHCIYWPIILKANQLRLPTKIISHGWILTNEEKMSKSKGNVINPLKIIEKYGYEQLKYYLASQIKIGEDGIFNKNNFINVINSDLANNIGNLVSRTITMILKNFNRPIKYTKNFIAKDQELIKKILNTWHLYKKYFDDFKISMALKEVIHLGKKLNHYIDENKPWILKNNKTRLEQIFNLLLNGIYAVATMLNVVMPQAMTKIKKQLNIDELSFNKIKDFKKFDQILIKKGKITFKKIK